MIVIIHVLVLFILKLIFDSLLPVDSTIIDDTTVEDVLDINKEEELFHKQKELQQKLLKQPMSFSTKYQKLSASLGEVLDDLGILYFHTLDIQDKQVSKQLSNK